MLLNREICLLFMHIDIGCVSPYRHWMRRARIYFLLEYSGDTIPIKVAAPFGEMTLFLFLDSESTIRHVKG